MIQIMKLGGVLEDREEYWVQILGLDSLEVWSYVHCKLRFFKLGFSSSKQIIFPFSL
jgi:hypothetical protein